MFPFSQITIKVSLRYFSYKFTLLSLQKSKLYYN